VLRTHTDMQSMRNIQVNSTCKLGGKFAENAANQVIKLLVDREIQINCCWF